MVPQKNTLRKNERLFLKKKIEQLFETRHKISGKCFMILYKKASENQVSPAEVMFVVPKKIVRKAVNRNKIKRTMREIYRLQKNNFYANIPHQQVYLAIVYRCYQTIDYEIFESEIQTLLTELSHKLSEPENI